MGRPYSRELAELAAVVAATRSTMLDEAEISPLRGAASGPAVFVGSGGARAVAELAAALHRSLGRPGWGMTPLEFEQLPPMPSTSVVVISAAGKNRDTRAAVRRAACWDMPPTVLTTRSRAQLHAEVARSAVHVVTIPSPQDGFLATSSTLAFATALCGIYGFGHVPDELGTSEPSESVASLATSDRVLVLHGPGALPAAMDLEIRLSEVGLGAVQLADFRNFAHGRHVGLGRNRERTGIVTFVDPESKALGDATARLIPGERPIELSTRLPFPYGTVDLIALSARATGVIGNARSIDPGQPEVADWGRRLYSLSRRMKPADNSSAVARKLAVLPTVFPAAELRASFDGWMRDIRQVRFKGIVLDYDGTCCQTADRYERLPSDVVVALQRLLEGGMQLGVASGRGRSLYAELQAVLRQEHWPQVLIGTHNCYDLRSLSDDVPARVAPRGHLGSAAARLEELESLGFSVTARAGQIQVEPAAPSGCTGTSIAGLVSSLLARTPQIPCRVVASGHSVDVLSQRSSKLTMLRAVAERVHGEVLVVGDQGSEFGNDFELLAATRWSVSVGSCSADPTRCWRLGDDSPSGPPLLVRYLDALRQQDGAWTFDWNSER